MQWVYADPGRIVGLAKSNYIRRVGARAGEREPAAPSPDASGRELPAARVSGYLRRERARADDLGAHVLVTRGLPVTSGEQLARVLDARERKKDRSYRCYGGQLPRVATHLIASLPYGTTPEQAEAVVCAFVYDISDRLLVPIEAQIHLKNGQPDHFHALLGTRVVENGRLGGKQRALDAVSEKRIGEAVMAGGHLVGNTMEWLRSEWARRTRELSDDGAIDHRSYRRRGLAITPVTYVLRREIEEERQQGTALWRERRRAELAARHPAGMMQRPAAAAPATSDKSAAPERHPDDRAATERHADQACDALPPPARAVDEAARGAVAALAGALGLDMPDVVLVELLREQARAAMPRPTVEQPRDGLIVAPAMPIIVGQHASASADIVIPTAALGLDLPDAALVAMWREHVLEPATTTSDRYCSASSAVPALPVNAEKRAADRTAVAPHAEALLDALLPPDPVRKGGAADDVGALAGILGLDMPDDVLVTTLREPAAARSSHVGRSAGNPIVLSSLTSATAGTIEAPTCVERTSGPEPIGEDDGAAAPHSARHSPALDAAAIRERVEALLDALIGATPRDGSDRELGIGGELAHLLGLPTDALQALPALLRDQGAPRGSVPSRHGEPLPDRPAPSTAHRVEDVGGAVAAELAELAGLCGPYIPGVVAARVLRNRARQLSGGAAAGRAVQGAARPVPAPRGAAGGAIIAVPDASVRAGDGPASRSDGHSQRPARSSGTSATMSAPLSPSAPPALPTRGPAEMMTGAGMNALSGVPGMSCVPPVLALRTGQAKDWGDAEHSSLALPPDDPGQPLVGRYDRMVPRRIPTRPDAAHAAHAAHAAPEQPSRALQHAVTLYRQLHHDRRMTVSRVEELAGMVGVDRAAFEAAARAATEAAPAPTMVPVAVTPALPPRFEQLVQRWNAEDNEKRREQRKQRELRARAGEAELSAKALIPPTRSIAPPAVTEETHSPASPPGREGTAQRERMHWPAVPVSGETADAPMADSPSPRLMPEGSSGRPVTPGVIAAPPTIGVPPATQAMQAIAASLDPALVDSFVADVRDAARSQGRELPSDAALRRGVALRLRAIGCPSDRVEVMLRCCPGSDRAGVDLRRVATDAFSAGSTDLLRKRGQFVGRMRQLATRVEIKVYRDLRRQAMIELRHDLDAVWGQRRLQAAEAERRHRRHLDLLFAIRWWLRRAGRDGLAMAIMTALVEKAVLQRLIDRQKTSAAAERQAILAQAQRASASHRASREDWLRQLDASREAAAAKGMAPPRKPLPSQRRNNPKEDGRSR